MNTGMMQGQRGGTCCIRAVALVVGKASGVIVRGFAFGALLDQTRRRQPLRRTKRGY